MVWTPNPNLVQLGTVDAGATAINADVSQGLGQAVTVTLLKNYARTGAPGFPAPPSMTGVAAAGLNYPRTIPSGTVITVLQVEATALQAAGAA